MNKNEIREGLYPTADIGPQNKPTAVLLITGHSLHQFMLEFVPIKYESDNYLKRIPRRYGGPAVRCLNDYFINPTQLPSDLAEEYDICEIKLANAVDEILYVFEFMLEGSKIAYDEITFEQHRATCSLLVELT